MRLPLAASLLVALTNIAVAQRTNSDSAFRAVDRVFDAYRGSDRPGCAVGVSRNGAIVYERGYGMANLETDTPIRPSSIFHVASVSKQFTAMAILLLARDGKLSVDDDIRKYLPEIPNYGTTITIRHLLSHTSGLRDQWELLGLARGRFEENRITEADVMDIVPRQKALNFTPGAEYLYSNTGFTLLAVIVKRVSGQPLRDFAAARMFAPLGMSHTHFHDDYSMLVPGRTSAYESVPGGWRVSIPNYDTYGATSLFTTTADLLRWEANFDNPVVGDRAIIAQMQTPTVLTNGDTVAYGFGVVVDRYRGQRRVSHGGADAGYRSWLGRYPDQGLAIALACNTSTVNTTLVAQAVADAFLPPDLSPPVTPQAQPVAIAVPDSVLRRRAGAWMNPVTRQVTELAVRDGKLSIGRTTGPSLIPVADNRFRVVGQPTEIIFFDGPRTRFEQSGAAHPLVYERQAPADAKPGALRAYAGEYYSDELDSRYRVTAGDTTISLRTGTSEPMIARPMFADGFVSGGYTIEFTRKGAQVIGFEVTNARMRRVRFTRVPPPR